MSKLSKFATASRTVLASVLALQLAHAQTQTGTAAGGAGNVAGTAVGAMGGIASQVVAGLPSMYRQNPQQLMLEGLQSQLQTRLAGCQMASLGQTVGGKAAKTVSEQIFKDLMMKRSKPGESVGKVAGAKADACNDWKDLEKSLVLPQISCSSLVKNVAGDQYQSKELLDSEANLEAKHLKFAGIDELIKSVKVAQGPECPAELAELRKQQEAFACMSNAMKEFTGQVGLQLQTVLQASQQQFAKMQQFEGEVQSQIAQVDQILGPDKELGGSGSSQFSGLLGLQKALEEQMQSFEEGEATFKNKVTEVDEGEKANEQALEVARMNFVGSCLMGDATAASGGSTLQCPVPVFPTGQDGKPDMTRAPLRTTLSPCGPIAYIRSRIEQRAMVNSRGRLMNRDGNRRQQSMEYASSFDAAANAIMNEFVERQQGAGGGMSTSAGLAQSASITWKDIQSNNNIMNKLRALDSDPNLKGVNIIANLERATGKCMSDSMRWRSTQVTSQNSEYSKAKRQIKAQREELHSKLESGMNALNKNFASAMSVLSDQHVAVERFSCKNSSKKMVECYSTMKQNLRNLLEGNGQTGFTSKAIKGGTMVPGFQVPCRGINGCVTALKTVRDKQRQQMIEAGQMKAKFVTDGNKNTQDQLQAFSKVLQVGSQTMGRQYDMMKSLMSKLGAKGLPESLSMMEGENLEQMESEGPDGKPVMGPFKSPKNMAAVLSQMAGGIPDPSNSGVGKALESAEDAISDRKKALTEKIKELQEQKAEIKEKFNNCVAGALPPGGGASSGKNVGHVKNDCDNVHVKLNRTLAAFGGLPKSVKVDDFVQSMVDIFSGKSNSAWNLVAKENPNFASEYVSLANNGCEDQVKNLKYENGAFSTSSAKQGN